VSVLRLVGEQLRGAVYDLRLDAEHQPLSELLEELVDLHRLMATSCEIESEIGDEHGRGFDATAPVSALHHGITGMHARAELLKGHLEIHSDPGVGTTVRLDATLTSDD
jgi:nitrate/nitrite-specific signal transduction histidine kinase